MSKIVTKFDDGLQGAIPKFVKRPDLSGMEPLEELLKKTSGTDAVSRRAQLSELLNGCTGRGSTILARIGDAMCELRDLSAPNAFLENHRAHELWKKLDSAGEMAVSEKRSVPFAMAPILQSRDAVESYESFTASIETYLFDTLFADFGERLELVRRMVSLNALNDDAATVIAARHELTAMKDELQVNYRSDLEGFGFLNGVFSNIVGALYATDDSPDTAIRGAWHNAFRMAADLIRDADDALTSFDVSFMYFAYYSSRADIEAALNVCRMPEVGSVGLIMRRAVSLNLPRADARGTEIKVGKLPLTNLPDDVRHDLFRSINMVMINAIRSSNLSLNLEKEDRFVEVSCRENGPDDAPSSVIEIIVEDNGNGIGNLSVLGRDYNSWLSRLRRIAARRGWALRLQTAKGEGSKVDLRIDVKNWGGDWLRIEEEKRTIPGLGPSAIKAYGGIVEEPSVCADKSQPSEVSGDVEGIVPEETASVEGSVALAAVAALGNGFRRPTI